MVSVVKRMRKLQALLFIRSGPGAAILPPEVARIHMDFALNTTKGHHGAKQFWRNHLIRLKYHNPAVPMTVNRTEDASGPALMTLHFSSPSGNTPNPSNPSESTEIPTTTQTIDMRNLESSAIFAQLTALTKARVLRTDLEDAKIGQDLEEQEARNNRVRELMQAAMARRKREKAILAQARGEVEALKNET